MTDSPENTTGQPALPPDTDPPADPAQAVQDPHAFVNLIDPKLKQRALKRLQGLVKGNGIKAEDVTLEDCTALVYPFGARTFVRPAPVYGIRTEPGMNKVAKLATSLEDFNFKLKSAVEQARSNLERRKIIVDFLFQRPDKGFGLKDQKVKFEALTEDFVMHDGCITCSRNGRTRCQTCTGRGMVPCSLCQSREQIVCPQCRGSGKTPGSSKPESCIRCRGDGKIQCTQCVGRGQTKCPKCAARGTLQCQKCAGTGWLSNLAHVEMEAQLHFDFDRQALPLEVIKLVDAFGSRLVEKGDIEVRLHPPQPTTPEEMQARQEPPDMIFIDYAAKVPCGPIQFRLKDRVIPATLFGYQGRLIEAPSFLEDLTRKGRQALAEAAAGHGNVAENVKKAGKYRMLRDVILQAAQGAPQRKAIETLTTRYPTGISADKLLNLLIDAGKALKVITRKPRGYGLATGILLFAGLIAGYGFFGGRAWLSSLGLGPGALTGVDALLLPFGTLLGTFTAQIFALGAQQKAIAGLAPPEIIARMTPRIGKTIWWSLGAAALVTILLFVGLWARWMGAEKLSWMASIGT